MPFGAGHWPYLIILLVIVLIIWGPGKLPDLGSGLGKAIREFRKASNDVKDQIVNSSATEPATTTAPAPAQPQPVVQAPQPVAPAQPQVPVQSVPSPQPVQSVPPASAPQAPAQPTTVPPVGQPTEHPSV
jgi:TatA/E family protein of Tat protein translocase